MKSKVVIVGGNHLNTLGVIRSLGREGLYLVVILTNGDKSSFVLKSRYVKEYYLVDGSAEAVKLLLQLGKSDSEKRVIIACHDEIASEIDLNFDKLSQFYYLSGMNRQGGVSKMMDKEAMGRIAKTVGLNVPPMMICNAKTIQISKLNNPPYITKPVKSVLGKKSDISVFKDTGDLISFINNHPDNSFIVQQYIDRSFEFQFMGCSLDGGEIIIIPGVSNIIRPTKSSNIGFLHYLQLDNTYNDSLAHSISFIQTIKYSGLFSVEFIRDKDGKDWFLEMNFRNDGNTIAVMNAGVNLPFIWYLHCNGEDIEKEIKPIHDEFVMPEFYEIGLYTDGLISWKDLKEDMALATSYMCYAPDDLAPTRGWRDFRFQKTISPLKRIVKSIIRR